MDGVSFEGHSLRVPAALVWAPVLGLPSSATREFQPKARHQRLEVWTGFFIETMRNGGEFQLDSPCLTDGSPTSGRKTKRCKGNMG